MPTRLPIPKRRRSHWQRGWRMRLAPRRRWSIWAAGWGYRIFRATRRSTRWRSVRRWAKRLRGAPTCWRAAALRWNSAAGWSLYLTRVVDRKTSHGETFLVTDGGLHHQLAASGNFGTVIRRNYPIAVAHAFGAEPAETVSVVGCLCTPLDRFGDQVGLPYADVGDLIAIFQAGAYGASASPAAFLGQGPAREMLV